MLPLVHHDDYVTPLPEGHRFPMPKFNLLRDVLVAEGVAAAGGFHVPSLATREDLLLAHDAGYVDAFCRGGLDAGHVRRIGLPWSPGLVNRTRTALGGTLLAARLAVERGLAANCAGGTHHAFRDAGAGFCIFNDLAVAARWLRWQGLADHVLIVDLDVHQGDGTASILADEPGVVTFSMHCGRNFPLRKVAGSLDVSLPTGMGDDAYLDVLANGCGRAASDDRPWASGGFDGLEALLERVEPDVVLYDAGVDVHRDDDLGRLALTDAGLLARDTFVIETCRRHRIPTCCVIGGGYDHDHLRLARRHATVHRAAAAVWGREHAAQPA